MADELNIDKYGINITLELGVEDFDDPEEVFEALQDTAEHKKDDLFMRMFGFDDEVIMKTRDDYYERIT